ncbi:hypothetical protein Hanom_Chr05g00425241 [Helianthus anomalus]
MVRLYYYYFEACDMKHFSDMIFPPVEEDDGKSNIRLRVCGVIGYSIVFNRC